MTVFWSNGLVGTITTLAFTLLFWPVISALFERGKRLLIAPKTGRSGRA
jgi:putative tricarboxylic transport membrane protein